MNLFEKKFTQRQKLLSQPIVKTKDAKFYFVIIALLSCCLFFGCEEPNDDGNLNGTWSAYDSYKIDTVNKKIEYDGGDNSGYKADIINSPDYGASNGILIIKFTWYYKIEYSWEPPYDVISEGETNEYNEKIGAVYWKNLTSGSVQMSDAYDTVTWSRAMYDTPEEAQTNFTIDKTSDYISQWGSYTK